MGNIRRTRDEQNGPPRAWIHYTGLRVGNLGFCGNGGLLCGMFVSMCVQRRFIAVDVVSSDYMTCYVGSGLILPQQEDVVRLLDF